MPVPILVISLKRSTDRRAAISSHLAGYGLTPKFFDAVDGRAMLPEDIAAMHVGKNPRYATPLKPGEIGAGASFHGACLEIASGCYRFVCLLEDDAIQDKPIHTAQDCLPKDSLESWFE